MKILAVGPHPDDVEFGCAALLIQEVRKGNQVRTLVASLGEAGTSGTPDGRAEESRAAARLIGAEIAFLDFGGDCHVQQTPANAMAIARHIREFRPDIVLAPTLDENQHPDHPVVGRMVRDACRFARYGGLADLRDLPVHHMGSLYFYNITQMFSTRPDIVVDVSDVAKDWEAVIRCHQSQMKTKGYLDLVQSRARSLGLSIGCDYAIGLWVNDPVRVNSISDLTLSSRNY